MEQKKPPDKPIQFDKFYTQLRQATHIKYIKDNEEHLYKLHESTKIIYTFLLQRFSANNRKLMYLSYDRVAAECALSRRTVIDKINELVGISVVNTSSPRSILTGRNSTTLYTSVENLVTSNRFKLYSQSLKDYYAQLQSKQEKLTSLADYVRCNLKDEYKKEWTRQQASNFWRNTNNELITGEYFKGLDKSARLHYKLDFHKEELEDFEITLLQDNLNSDELTITTFDNV